VSMEPSADGRCCNQSFQRFVIFLSKLLSYFIENVSFCACNAMFRCKSIFVE
jgi:hypothetical protein